jgi:hypothetical protein
MFPSVFDLRKRERFLVHELSNAICQIPWYAWIAIVAIVSGGVTQMLRQRYKHLERMEMIRQGLDPDKGKPALPPEC